MAQRHLVQVFIIGNFRERGDLECGIVYVAAKVRVPVAHHEVVGPQHAVVRADLLKGVRRYGDVGSLIFDDGTRKPAFAAVKHAVAPASGSSNPERHLVG